MKNNKLYLIAALLGTFLAGCQVIEEEIVNHEECVQPEVTSYTMTLEATKGVDTKALSLDGSTLNAYWQSSEKVKVYKDGSCIGTLDVTPDAGEKPTTATLSGTIDNMAGLAKDVDLMLLIPREIWNYSGQKGTIADIASNYDYAVATVTITAVDGGASTISTTDATFTNQQSIYRFAFQVSSTPLSVKGFTVSSATLVQTHTWNGSAWIDTAGPIAVNIDGSGSASQVYASLRNTLAGTSVADTYSFSVVGSDDVLYVGDKSIPNTVIENYGIGKYVSTTVTVAAKVLAPKPSGDISDALEVL